LVVEHLSLVRVIALHVLATLPKHVELEDLEQAGTLGLLNAADRFDASLDVNFATYAKHRIRGAILDSLRQADPMSRELRREKRKIDEASNVLEQQLNREPTEPEIAEALDMDLGRLRDIRWQLFNSQSMPVLSHPEEGGPEPQFAGSYEDRPDAIYSRGQLKRLLLQATGSLSERWREVLRLYYVEELPMREIGERLGVNESRVSQIHKA